MRLKILLPPRTLLDEQVRKVIAEAENGSFGILPRHIDFVAPLVPGILIYETTEGEERYVALDQGVLVKQGSDVLVSARQAVRGEALGRLRETVETQFRQLEDREKLTRSALARLESNIVRRFMELGRLPRE